MVCSTGLSGKQWINFCLEQKHPLSLLGQGSSSIKIMNKG